jgi:hypothetical protein
MRRLAAHASDLALVFRIHAGKATARARPATVVVIVLAGPAPSPALARLATAARDFTTLLGAHGGETTAAPALSAGAASPVVGCHFDLLYICECSMIVVCVLAVRSFLTRPA